MGYLKDGKEGAFFIRLSDSQLQKLILLSGIFSRTKKKRIKSKIAKQIDNMVAVEE